MRCRALTNSLPTAIHGGESNFELYACIYQSCFYCCYALTEGDSADEHIYSLPRCISQLLRKFTSWFAGFFFSALAAAVLRALVLGLGFLTEGSFSSRRQGSSNSLLMHCRQRNHDTSCGSLLRQLICVFVCQGWGTQKSSLFNSIIWATVCCLSHCIILSWHIAVITILAQIYFIANALLSDLSRVRYKSWKVCQHIPHHLSPIDSVTHTAVY